MHLTPDALHRILSVPVVDTMAVVSYQLQDLWISPVAATTATLSTLQVSQLMADGVFWRLEPMLFCEQSVIDLWGNIPYPEDFVGIKSAVSSYSSQYELTCRAGMNYGPPIGLLQKTQYYPATTTPIEQLLGINIGGSAGSIPYVYKAISVSKTAFSKLTEWPHGFTVARTVEYANENADNVVNYSDSQFNTLPFNASTMSSTEGEFLWDSLSITPIGLDEGYGVDEKHFTFAPNLEPSALNSGVLQTLEGPKAIGWQYIPIEAKTTSQPFPTSTTNGQAAYITAEIAKLFPLSTNPITPLDSSQAAALQTLAIRNLESATIKYLRDTASNYCSQFDWAQQARNFDAVALRQKRLLDFNAIPIAPLEMSKDYATLTTAPDAGLACYGDLPAIAWAPDPADDSKVFALCRYRPPIRVPLPDWSWGNIGLPEYIKDIAVKDFFDPSLTTIEALEEKKPFKYYFGKKTTIAEAITVRYYNSMVLDQQVMRYNTDTLEFKETQQSDSYFRAVWRNPVNPLVELKNPADFEFRNSFYPSFSPKLCADLAPPCLSMGFGYAYLTDADPPVLETPYAEIYLLKKRGQTGWFYEAKKFVYAAPEKKAEIEADLDGFTDWANEFFLTESSYSEIGRYRWLDENGTAMVDLPFYGHSAIFNSFNIDISLRPAPQG